MIERTALRLATVMALANGFAAPWPTMAQGRVFDTRFDPMQLVDLASDDVLPVITVCTDDDRGTSLSQNNGGPAFEHTVTLTIDISVGMVGAIDEKPAFVTMPQTEPELEAMLDLFERQVKLVFVNPLAVWTEELNKIARRITDWSSTRYQESDSNIRLAARRLTMSVMLPLEDLMPLTAVPPVDAAVPPPLGPLLTAIIASESPYAPAAEALQDLLLSAGAGQTLTIPTLERVRFIEADQATENNAGTPKGPRPDGVAEVELPVTP